MDRQYYFANSASHSSLVLKKALIQRLDTLN